MSGLGPTRTSGDVCFCAGVNNIADIKAPDRISLHSNVPPQAETMPEVVPRWGALRQIYCGMSPRFVLPTKWGGLFRKTSRLPVAASAYGRMATMIASRRRLTANSFDLGRALRRGSRSRLAFRRGLRVADRLGLRIADRLGQHRM
jgi:hypothetical protein